MIEIGQTKHSTTVIRLDSVFAHSDGLQCRKHWDDGDLMGDSIKGGGGGVLSADCLISPVRPKSILPTTRELGIILHYAI